MKSPVSKDLPVRGRGGEDERQKVFSRPASAARVRPPNNGGIHPDERCFFHPARELRDGHMGVPIESDDVDLVVLGLHVDERRASAAVGGGGSMTILSERETRRIYFSIFVRKS